MREAFEKIEALKTIFDWLWWFDWSDFSQMTQHDKAFFKRKAGADLKATR